MKLRTLILTCALLASPALAQETPSADSTIIAERTEAISKTLRCVVCQNQSIADSNATLAEDMRNLVRTRVLAGDSDDDVRAYMQERYGDFVLMEPPFKSSTLMLWFGPLLLILAGLIWFVLSVRKPGAARASDTGEDQDLSDDERTRLKDLLRKDTTPL